MKKWFLHILLLAGLFGTLTTSCSQDEEIANIPSAGTPSEKVTIRFTLDLGEQGGMSSRATWEGYDEDGTDDRDQAVPGIDDENAINNIQVFMFSTDGAYIGGLKDLEYERQDNSNIYNIKGEVDVVKTAIGANEVLNCKIMVVANADAASTNSSGAVIGYNNGATFNHDASYIPMWGIGTYSINLIQQLQVDLEEPIYMLRSMAKIEVKLSDDVYNNGYRITSATLNNYNTQGYVVPAFVIPETDESTIATTQTVNLSNLAVTTDLSTAGVYRPLANKSTNKALSNIDNKKTYVIYVPEMAKGKGTDAEPYNKVSLQLGRVTDTDEDGNETITDITNSVMNGTPHIVLKHYAQGGSHFDITRNHWYQYTINQVNDGIEATLKVMVNEWNTDEEIWDYREQVSVETSGKMEWEDVKENETDNDFTVNIDKVKNEVYVPVATKEKPAVCTFRLSTPAGGTWYASFEEQTGDYGAFKFLQTTTVDGKQISEEVTSVSGKVGEEATLRIITTNTTPTVTSSAKLRIAVRTSDGRTIIVKELLKDQENAEYTLVQSQQ